MRLRFTYIFVLISLQICTAFAQQKSGETNRLENIRIEIAGFQTQLAENASRKKSILQSLQELDYEIALHEKLLDELKRTEGKLADRLQDNSALMAQYKEELSALREDFKERAVSIYKYGRPNTFEYLFHTQSVEKVIALRKYLLILAKRDARSIKTITDKSQHVSSLNESLTSDLVKQQNLIRDTQKEAQLLLVKKNERQKLLTALRQDNNRMQLAIAERKNAEQSVLNEITALSENNVETPKISFVAGFTEFAQTKGNLPWPAQGTVTAHMGLEHDPVTKTKTVNRGIDILSRYGAEVKAVCDGRVAKIKWLPWYGQTIFVQHSGDYYTVYARLSEISINIDEAVITNQVIGKVGREASTSEAKLHFQIWKGSETLDPESWLMAANTISAKNSAKTKKSNK